MRLPSVSWPYVSFFEASPAGDDASLHRAIRPPDAGGHRQQGVARRKQHLQDRPEP
jgi:hypothetical protein